MKYRIVKMKGDKELYKIQKKSFLFGWKNLKINVYREVRDGMFFDFYIHHSIVPFKYEFSDYHTAEEYLKHIMNPIYYKKFNILPCVSEEDNNVCFFFINRKYGKSDPNSLLNVKKEIDGYSYNANGKETGIIYYEKIQ